MRPRLWVPWRRFSVDLSRCLKRPKGGKPLRRYGAYGQKLSGDGRTQTRARHENNQLYPGVADMDVSGTCRAGNVSGAQRCRKAIAKPRKQRTLFYGTVPHGCPRSRRCNEDKFIAAYDHGRGGIYISEAKFDRSTQTYLVQVSVPVMDGDIAIGAITVGINLDLLETSAL